MPFKRESFEKVVYFAHGGTGLGQSAAEPLPLADGDLWPIPAGCVVSRVSVVVTTAITGTTQLDIGDDDDPNGFVAAATLTADAVTGNNGAYLYNTGAELAKYYSATGKEVKLDATGASTAGAGFVIISGFMG